MVKRRMKTTTTTTAKANTILEKKLEELEGLLEEIGSGNGDHTIAYREFKDRFLFTHTLLAAEISSVKEGEEGAEEKLKLRCMAKRLAELEEAFKDLTGPIDEPNMQSLESGGGGGVNVDDEQTGLIRSLVETLHGEYKDDASLEEKLAKRKTERMKTKRFRGLVSFGLVAFVASMVSFYGYLCDQTNEKTVFLTPT
ncbi:PREDICTED: uncharacterized protein LOC104726838 [Camelina sativa]|uniref:Uncharacterized protein LOC104726838 n=1 Tax=Camelina sativa TaxID=90675 RepID=A0ABM0UPB7_CAMSA|nr:PREDICTED: uncharacterized protein LOC104726838 [Camelina sativa]